MAKVGFIGLGNMGGPMAENLVKAGHDVKVFDLSAEALARLEQAGAKVADSAKAAVADVEFVVSMLPASKHVQSLYLGEQGIAEHIDSQTLVIDSSTIDAQTARDLAVTLNKQGVRFIDAPVSGGTAGAKAATLTFICGGDAADIEEARAVLGNMGKNVFRAGDHGAGQVAKICNNMLLAILMAGTSEALQLGRANGLDPKVLSQIMLQSSGRNWTLEVYNPCPYVMEGVPSSNNYAGGFQVDLMAKDLGLAMDTAQAVEARTPLGEMAQSLYQQHSQDGFGGKDFSSIFNYFDTKLNQ
ncbi:3-hydroxyisobutyrate dehydrogenase [Aliidiomarina maris]|uniref:3-hydroxyisobutyrate dehydrogenase n=1 Tax=Aliidiomarina maris TaxID=531312 RepID=A0A327WUP3_9GAMM|nr:3-hydroxyisobutyrate dehydrogenase [Aliidiomarina maris]MBA3988621.1 3-hydroxyisobutyrate dehydrogenase [Idiomarina sp.]RAJ96552.1 3-hydroxyisobutyrate dehydrogenase [Aliidiomarina maris]RUO23820.1 3-hydroxyisobutyrate dehydrogenase [Aliidiomarina maris]